MSTQGSIKKDNSGLWFFVVDIAGTDGKRKQLRRRGFRTKGAAQQELTKVLGDVQRGSFVKPTKQTVGVFRRFGFQGGVSWLRSDQLGLPA